MRCLVLCVGVIAGVLGLACQLIDPLDALQGGKTDAGTDSAGDAPSSSDPGVRCVNTFCTVPGQVCCFNPVDGGAACTPQNGCIGAPPYRYFCDDHADCVAQDLPNDVCCASYNATYVTGSVCAAMCTGGSVLCDPTVGSDCTNRSCLSLTAFGALTGSFSCH